MSIPSHEGRMLCCAVFLLERETRSRAALPCQRPQWILERLSSKRWIVKQRTAQEPLEERGYLDVKRVKRER